MTRRGVAFLRGINVGGRRITGPEMVEIAAGAGFTDAVAVERDLIASVGTQIYWVPHTGVSDADLKMADIERAAGSVTFRTLGTVERLIAKFS